MLDVKNTFSLTKPDDMHLHLRDAEALRITVPATARQFARAIVMPNLKTPITTIEQAQAYAERIQAAVPAGLSFEPLMTLYLNADCRPEDIAQIKSSGIIYGIKYYPKGGTTHAQAGLLNLKQAYPVFEQMQKHGLPLLIHGETVNPEVDIFDRERVFLEEELAPLLLHFPELKVVLEHITTQEAADFIRTMPSNVAATITAHHLWYDRNVMFKAGLNPHYYCMPILKRARHQQALIRAATSGDSHFFLGTDSAPHARSRKESACGCAGVFSAPHAIEWYARVFEQAQALDKLEAFSSYYGADFYGLPRNTEKITLRRETIQIPETLPFNDEVIVPMGAGEVFEGWAFVDDK